jgi:hypothetical protein
MAVTYTGQHAYKRAIRTHDVGVRAVSCLRLRSHYNRQLHQVYSTNYEAPHYINSAPDEWCSDVAAVVMVMSQIPNKSLCHACNRVTIGDASASLRDASSSAIHRDSTPPLITHSTPFPPTHGTSQTLQPLTKQPSAYWTRKKHGMPGVYHTQSTFRIRI